MSLQREQQPVNTIATRMQRKAVPESTSSLMNYLSHARVALLILGAGRKAPLQVSTTCQHKKNDNDTWGANCSGQYSSP